MDSATQRTYGLALAAAAMVAGLAAAFFGIGALVVFFASAAGLGALARPREAAILLGLASPLDNLVVVQTGAADIRFLEVLWLLVVVSLLVRAALRRPVELAHPPRWLTALLVAMVAWTGVSAVVSGLGFSAYRETAQLAGFAVMLWLFAASFAALPADLVRRCVRGAAIVGIVLVALTLLDYAADANVPYTVLVVLGKSITFSPPALKSQVAASAVSLLRFGVFNQAIVTSASLVASTLTVALAFALASSRGGDRLLAWVGVGLSGVLLLLTFSRASWLFALVAVVLVAWRAGAKRLFGALAALGVVGAGLLSIPAVSARLSDFSTESSTLGHIDLWVRAFGAANAAPVFGNGPGSFAATAGDPAHNYILAAAADTGWPGAAIVVALTGRLLAWTWRVLRPAPVIEFSVWVALLVATAMNLTMNGFTEEMWWIWGGLAAGLAMRRAVAAQGHLSQEVPA